MYKAFKLLLFRVGQQGCTKTFDAANKNGRANKTQRRTMNVASDAFPCAEPTSSINNLFHAQYPRESLTRNSINLEP
jgi:hypothetical protein